jgi:integrase
VGKKRRKRARGEGAVYQYVTTGGKNVRWRAELPGGKSGKAGFPTQAEALAWLRQNIGKTTAPDTVGEWLARWLELHRAEWKPQTHRRFKFSVTRWWLPRIGSVKLRDLTGLHVKASLAEMAAEGVKDPERHKAGSHLRQALNSAVALGVLHANPMTAAGRVKLPSPRPPEKKAFSPAQAKALVQAADQQGKGHQVRLWLDAGLRPAELMGLDWEDIDLAKGTVRVVRAWDSLHYLTTDPKTPQSRRTIRLSAATVASLKAAGPGSGPFIRPRPCPGVGRPRKKGERFWQSEFHRAFWEPMLAKAELLGQGFTPYSVRHTCATHLLRSGVPIKAVSRRLGHSTPTQTLNTYAHVLEGDDDAAAEVMGGLLSG